MLTLIIDIEFINKFSVNEYVKYKAYNYRKYRLILKNTLYSYKVTYAHILIQKIYLNINQEEKKQMNMNIVKGI